VRRKEHYRDLSEALGGILEEEAAQKTHTKKKLAQKKKQAKDKQRAAALRKGKAQEQRAAALKKGKAQEKAKKRFLQGKAQETAKKRKRNPPSLEPRGLKGVGRPARDGACDAKHPATARLCGCPCRGRAVAST